MDKKSVEATRMRNSLNWPRFALHTINLVIHITNLVILHQTAESNTNPDPQVVKFLSLRFRYLTTWVVMLHIIYSALSLLPWVLLTYGKLYVNTQDQIVKLLTRLNRHTEVLFKGVVWPSTILVTVFFWSVFIYNRELIFPKFVDEVVGFVSNHILHTWIAIFIILEVLFYPRLFPRRFENKSIWIAKLRFSVLYGLVFYFTVYYDNVWLYPIFGVAYKSGFINFFVLHAVIALCFCVA